ncbi:hypothetical protein GP486_005463, partial [Trichoglossum hirsutum]
MAVISYNGASATPHGTVTTQTRSVWVCGCSSFGNATQTYSVAYATDNYSTTTPKRRPLSKFVKAAIIIACIFGSPIALGIAMLIAYLLILLVGLFVGIVAILTRWLFRLLLKLAKTLLCCYSSPSSQGRGGSAAHGGNPAHGGNIAAVTGPQYPLSQFSAARSGGRQLVERDPGEMVRILNKNVDRKVSRLGREMAKEVYPRGSNPPSPSKAWARLEAAATGTPHPMTCCVCEEDLPDHRFPDRDITNDCHGHSRGACLECVAREIQRTLETSSWSETQCILCPGRLNYGQISEFAFKEVFEKYDRLAYIRAIETDPNFRWCSDDACTQGQINDNGLNEPAMSCRRPGCSRRTCFLHHGQWHQGLTCQEYQRQIDPQFHTNEVTDAEKDQNPDLYGKGCPKCTRRIYKDQGCKHMT